MRYVAEGEDLLKFCRQYVMDALYFDLRDRQLMEEAKLVERVFRVIEHHFEHLRVADRIALRSAVQRIVVGCRHDGVWGQVCLSQVVNALLGEEVVPNYVVKTDVIGEGREPLTEQGRLINPLLKDLGIAGDVKVAVVYTGQGNLSVQDLEGEFSTERKMIYVVVADEGKPGFIQLSGMVGQDGEGSWVFTNEYFKALFHPLLRQRRIIA